MVGRYAPGVTRQKDVSAETSAVEAMLSGLLGRPLAGEPWAGVRPGRRHREPRGALAGRGSMCTPGHPERLRGSRDMAASRGRTSAQFRRAMTRSRFVTTNSGSASSIQCGALTVFQMPGDQRRTNAFWICT